MFRGWLAWARAAFVLAAVFFVGPVMATPGVAQPPTYFSTQAQAHNAVVAWMNGSIYMSYTTGNSSTAGGPYACFNAYYSYNGATASFCWQANWSCPTGSALSSATGTCVEDQAARDARCSALSATSAGHYTLTGTAMVIAINGSGSGGGGTNRGSIGGCAVESKGPADCSWSPSAGETYCTADWMYTGASVPVGTGSDNTIVDQTKPGDVTLDGRTSSTVQTQNGPGDSTTTVTTNKGTTVENRPDGSTVVTKPNGDTDVTRKTVVTTTNPDGSSTETQVEQRTVTIGGKTTTTFSGGSGVPITISGPTSTPATSSSGTTTTTTNRDAQGGVTGITTTTQGGNGAGAAGAGSGSGSGSGTGEEPTPDGTANAGKVVLPTWTDAPGFADSVNAFRDAVADSGIGQAAQSLGGLSDGGGTCSAPSFSLFGESFTFDFHCQVWPQIAPVISACALAAWAILAVMVLLSA